MGKYRLKVHKAGWWFARIQKRRWWGQWDSIPGCVEMGTSSDEATKRVTAKFEYLTGRSWSDVNR